MIFFNCIFYCQRNSCKDCLRHVVTPIFSILWSLRTPSTSKHFGKIFVYDLSLVIKLEIFTPLLPCPSLIGPIVFVNPLSLVCLQPHLVVFRASFTTDSKSPKPATCPKQSVHRLWNRSYLIMILPLVKHQTCKRFSFDVLVATFIVCRIDV